MTNVLQRKMNAALHKSFTRESPIVIIVHVVVVSSIITTA